MLLELIYCIPSYLATNALKLSVCIIHEVCLYCGLSQVLCCVLMVTSLCDVVKTVMDLFKDSDNVPIYQLLSPIVLLISAVSVLVCICVCVSVCVSVGVCGCVGGWVGVCVHLFLICLSVLILLVVIM